MKGKVIGLLKNNLAWTLALLIVVVFHLTGVLESEKVLDNILILAGINVLLSISLNLTTGFTGQFSLGHAGFMSAGAYVAAATSVFVTKDVSPGLVPFYFCGSLILAGIVGAALGALVGLPSFKLRGDYLAIVTLGFGEIIRVLLLNFDLVGGPQGLVGIPKWSNFGWVFGFVILALWSSWRIISSPLGRELKAIREDEVAAEMMGIHLLRAKLKVFIVSAFWAGVAGGLYAHVVTYIQPGNFDFNRSIEILIMVVLGGMGSLTGSVAAALFLTLLKEYLRDLQSFTGVDLRMIIYSLFLILLMLLRPQGLCGTWELANLRKIRWPWLKRNEAKS